MPKAQLEALIKINTGRPGWNKGKPQPKETAEKRRQTMSVVGYKTGESHPNFGKPMLPHVMNALKEANKNRDPWNKGVPMTETQRIKNKYRKPRKGVLQFDLAGNFVAEHFSLKDAADSMGCTKQNIYESCKDETKTAKGFKWKYKQEIPGKLIPGQSSLND